jgi:acetylornithine/succinyldiaminopimelate/putrescine aminotransferase
LQEALRLERCFATLMPLNIWCLEVGKEQVCCVNFSSFVSIFVDHGSTFAGSPLTAAAALHVLDRVNRPEFLKGVEVAGQHMRSRLFNMETLNVRGRGLISGFDVDPSRSSSDIVLEARDKGLFIHSAGPHTIRLIPALNITLDEIDEGLDILGGVLRKKD